MIRQSDYEDYDYRQFWRDDKRIYEDNAERIAIRKFFKGISKKGKIFADLGCGYGRLFSEYMDFDIIILVDYSVKNLVNARELILQFLPGEEFFKKKVFFVAADVNNLPLKDGILDGAMTVRVIHHISNPANFFSEVQRIIKPGSFFMLEFANKRNMKNILKFFAGKLKESPFSKRSLQIGETILDFHPAFIEAVLKEKFFRPVKKISASNFRVGFLKRYINLKVLLFLENLYQDLFSFFDFGPSIFIKTIFDGKPGITNFLKKEEDKTKEISSLKEGSIFNKAINIPGQDLFICPGCKKQALVFTAPNNKIPCQNCKREFSMENGIFNFKF